MRRLWIGLFVIEPVATALFVGLRSIDNVRPNGMARQARASPLYALVLIY